MLFPKQPLMDHIISITQTMPERSYWWYIPFGRSMFYQPNQRRVFTFAPWKKPISITWVHIMI